MQLVNSQMRIKFDMVNKLIASAAEDPVAGRVPLRGVKTEG